MLKERNFFDSSKSKQGEGIEHQYDPVEHEGEQLVIDHATGLMWQQAGSQEFMPYEQAEKYVRGLNEKRFAGYNDWRLPTLEEAMSLMEPGKHVELHLDSVFNHIQSWIWTADRTSSGEAWVVGFDDGLCYHHLVDFGHIYVRAVRTNEKLTI